MKTVTIIELFAILSEVKFTGMETSARFTLLENMRRMKPIKTDFHSSMEDARDKLKPEGFDKMLEKVKLHNEAVQNKQEENRLPAGELQDFRIMYENYEMELGDREKVLLKEEYAVEIAPIPLKDFEKLVEANDIEGGKLEVLYSMLLAHSK